MAGEHHSSYWRRRIAQHITIALTVLASTALFWELFSVRRDLISRLSIATAYPALLLTAAALVLGPWNVLRGRANPVSSDLRRDLGIWAGMVALLHTLIGLNVHLRGKPWLYFIDEHHHVRRDAFGLGNDTGLVAAVLFLLLVAISNDVSLRRLGRQRWKSWQRWTYLVALLTFLHGVAYQQVEKRTATYRSVLWGTITLIAAFQFSGWWKTKRIYPGAGENRKIWKT